jgi:hypothetical protein
VNWLRYLIIAIVILVLLALLIVLIIQFTGESNPEHSWNRKEDSNPYDTDSLYNRDNMPTLAQVLTNANFIEQVKVNNLTYIYGYSQDNEYLASIHYVNEEIAGYQLRITRLATDELEFSLFMPDTADIMNTKEAELAIELLRDGYQIERQARKLDWEDAAFNYHNAGADWSFVGTGVDEQISLQVKNLSTNATWIIRLDDLSNYLLFAEVFANPERLELLTFLFYFENKESGDKFSRKISLDLTKLSERNSESGIDDSADLWLYGDFNFIYNQWSQNNKRGFVAIVGEDTIANDGYYQNVEQWVYLDNTGRMQWYGNSVGIFDATGVPLDTAQNSYSYELNLIVNERNMLQQLVLEIYDNALNKQIKTTEFIWERTASMIMPVVAQ